MLKGIFGGSAKSLDDVLAYFTTGTVLGVGGVAGTLGFLGALIAGATATGGTAAIAIAAVPILAMLILSLVLLFAVIRLFSPGRCVRTNHYSRSHRAASTITWCHARK